jgi:hypothetical protein
MIGRLAIIAAVLLVAGSAGAAGAERPTFRVPIDGPKTLSGVLHHGFDRSGRVTDRSLYARNQVVVLKFDPAAAADARARMLEFFLRKL